LYSPTDWESSIYYKRIFADGNKKIDDALVYKAASLTEGFAYLVQLFGYNLWKCSDGEITPEIFARDLIFSL
jgi:hypothetical protein